MTRLNADNEDFYQAGQRDVYIREVPLKVGANVSCRGYFHKPCRCQCFQSDVPGKASSLVLNDSFERTPIYHAPWPTSSMPLHEDPNDNNSINACINICRPFVMCNAGFSGFSSAKIYI